MVDLEFYQDVYKGTECNQDFEQIELQASQIVNAITSYKIQNIDSYSDFIKTQIKLAICYQMDFINENGGVSSSGGSVAIGKFSYNTTATDNQIAVSPMVYMLLEPTGLLYRGDINV